MEVSLVGSQHSTVIEDGDNMNFKKENVTSLQKEGGIFPLSGIL